MDNRYVAAAEFKANCLRLMDEVARQRRPIIITRVLSLRGAERRSNLDVKI
jgi:hypothetical protein